MWLRISNLLSRTGVQRPKRRAYQPMLEVLEGRHLLATLTFAGDDNVLAAWENPRNWSPQQRLPTANDDVVIPLRKNVSVNSGAAHDISILGAVSVGELLTGSGM